MRIRAKRRTFLGDAAESYTLAASLADIHTRAEVADDHVDDLEEAVCEMRLFKEIVRVQQMLRSIREHT